MTLTLTVEEKVSRARADLRIGAPVVLISETGGAVILAAETLSPARLQDLRALAPPVLDLAITQYRAATLKARAYDGSLARVALSPNDGFTFVRATADPSIDLAQPMKGPYRTRRGGPSDLHALALALAKQARLLPACVLGVWEDTEIVEELARSSSLSCLDAETVAAAEAAAIRMTRVSGARVPTTFAAAGKVHVFRPEDGGEEHYAVEIGQPARSAPVLSRLHSACFTGDVIGSLQCDCGPQLNAALAHIAEEGAGVLLYMNQEGRGIGLANKMRAYA
ncbi:MAG: GTP cyclohydrolase II, partial [Pseudomonadota bacterium]